VDQILGLLILAPTISIAEVGAHPILLAAQFPSPTVVQGAAEAEAAQGAALPAASFPFAPAVREIHHPPQTTVLRSKYYSKRNNV
jgi:hypothetical protein